MVKSILTVLIAAAILAVGAYAEKVMVSDSCDRLYEMTETLQEKTLSKEASFEQAAALQKFWLVKKRSLHAFIPHNEVRDVDRWIAQTVTSLKFQRYEDAYIYLEVAKEIFKSLPDSFGLRFENIF